jgi:hypothetical protein
MPPHAGRSRGWLGWVVAAIVLVGAAGVMTYWGWTRAAGEDEARAAERGRRESPKARTPLAAAAGSTATAGSTTATRATAAGSTAPGPAMGKGSVPTAPPTTGGAPPAPVSKPPPVAAGAGQVRAAALSCWAANEGAQPGQKGHGLSVTITTNAQGNAVGISAVWGPFPRYRECTRQALHGMTFAPNQRLDVTVPLPASKTPAP